MAEIDLGRPSNAPVPAAAAVSDAAKALMKELQIPEAPPKPAPSAPTQGQSLAPAAPVAARPVMALDPSQMSFTVRTYTADGDVQVYSIPMPDSPDFAKWTLVQQIAALKEGVWKDISINQIMFGLAYAHRIGADPLLGDLFPTGNGRWGTSNKYKIRRALATQKVKGWTTEFRDTGLAWNYRKCLQQTDLECTVTVEVEGFTKPIVRKALLSRWYIEANPNWASRPEHMLELNTLAHAVEYVDLVGTEDDEAPPAYDATQAGKRALPPSVAELKAQRAQVETKTEPLQPVQRREPEPPSILDGALPDPTEFAPVATEAGKI